MAYNKAIGVGLKNKFLGAARRGGDSMLLYHGSAYIVKTPEIRSSVHTLDFGKGFYTTSNIRQAQVFAKRVGLREMKKGAIPHGHIVNIYECDMEMARREFAVLQYFEPDADWFSYITDNRLGRTAKNEPDIVIGPVANDNVYKIMTAFEAGIYDRDEALRRIGAFELFDQIVFKAERAVALLVYKGHFDIQENGDEG
jgi:hypothetical protein